MTDTATKSSEPSPPRDVAAERGVRPSVWWREQRGVFEGPQTLAPMYLLGPERPGSYESGATYEPLYDRAALEAAVAAERERCAKLCEEVSREHLADDLTLESNGAAACASRIRGPEHAALVECYRELERDLDQERKPIAADRVHSLWLECAAEVAKLDLEQRYEFAAWFGVAVRLVEREHGIGGPTVRAKAPSAAP